MYCKMILIATVLYVLSVANASSIAPFITPCKASDKACSISSAIKAVPKLAGGLPEFGVETLDPIHFDRVNSSLDSLKFILSDITIVGLKDCEPANLERDELPSLIKLRLICTLKLDGQYELNGKLLLLNLSGNGKIHVELIKVVFDFDLNMVTKTGADGEKYWHIKKFHHKYDLTNPSVVKFENLFQDNDALAQATQELIKTNGNEIVNEIGGKMIVEAIIRIVKNVNHFFAGAPAKYLSLD